MVDSKKNAVPSTNEKLALAQNRLIEHLQSSEKRYSDLVEHLRDVVFKLDADFNWVYLNKAWNTLTGFSIDKTINTSFLKHFSEDDHQACIKGFNSLLNGEQEDLTLQVQLISQDQKNYTIELSCRAFKNEIGQYAGIAGILSDITERITAQLKVSHLAYHDSLTGLANRRLLLTYLQEKLQSALTTTNKSALIFIDLDGFKQINDIYGHFIGDLLLSNVGEKIQHLLNEYESLASRIGGDEFVICLDLLETDKTTPDQQLLNLIDRLHRSISTLTTLNKAEVSITASIGALILDPKEMDAEKALTYADAAMYKAKRQGQNTTRLYDKAFQQEEFELKKFKLDIESAVANQDFVLYYQPQVEVDTNKITKVEGLIRWLHKEKGIIPPNTFIPYLEQSGMILEVGEWVLEEGCRQLNEWIKQGIDNITISLNVSAYQFMQPNFITILSDCIKKYNTPPHLLELELTEGVAIADVELAICKMAIVQQLGVKLALDDFGTGYSSLAYLKHFPVHTLKIDKSFIDGIPDDGYDAAIVQTTLVMANHLDLKVVAEGVETTQQLAFLQDLNCQLYQGYLYSKPLTAEDTFNLLIKDSKK